jgi:hypothetical protein
MSNPYLPPEMLDHTVDLLHDDPATLRRCCLVAKPWIPRTRKYLFANMVFRNIKDVRLWKKIFPDPANSPAGYAKTLYIGSHIVADPEVDGWIRGFSHVEHLKLYSHGQRLFPGGLSPFAPFHGFSPVIKSLTVVFAVLPPSWIFDLIISFPLIENLGVVVQERYAYNDDGSGEDEMAIATQPSNPPTFTGSLLLNLINGMGPFARRLLSLPGGIHCRDLTLAWAHDEDRLATMALVEECSHTLETLDITCYLYGTSSRHLCPH